MADDLSGWEESGGALRRRFEFADFSAAFAFMTRVALLAERRGHVGILTLKVLREEFVVVVESWPTRSPVKVTSIMLESRS